MARPGVYLLPAGSTMRDLIAAAGGMAEGHAFKAYQPGGPSSGLLPASLDDVPLDFDMLQPHGSLHRLGGGGGAVGPGHGPGGGAQHAALLRRRELRPVHPLPGRLRQGGAADAGASAGTASCSAELCQAMEDATICGLGQAAPNPIRLTMRHFPDEV